MKTRPLNRNNKLYLLRKELYAENSDKEDNFDDKLDYNEEMISDEHQNSSSSRFKIQLPISSPCYSINTLNTSLKESKINKTYSITPNSKSSSKGSLKEVFESEKVNDSYFSNPKRALYTPKSTQISIKNIRGERYTEFK